jgi:hypothetical protein
LVYISTNKITGERFFHKLTFSATKKNKMTFDKNILKFLQFRDKVLDIKELEDKYQIKLPPIYRSFITVFKPCFGHIKYKRKESEGFGSFVIPMYSSIEKENYTSDDDELSFDFFKEADEMLSWPPSNEGYLKDYLFIGNHGYSGGLLVGIGEENQDKIFHNTDNIIISYIAENIFELLQKFRLTKYDFDTPSIDETKLYKLWGEDFWRIKE